MLLKRFLKPQSQLTHCQQTDSQAASYTRDTQMARGAIWESACSMFVSWFLRENTLGSLDLFSMIKIFIHPFLKWKPKGVSRVNNSFFFHWSDTLSTYFRTNLVLGDPVDNLKLKVELGASSLPLRVYRKDLHLLFRGFRISSNVQEGWDM